MRLIDSEVFEKLFHKQIKYGANDVFGAVEDALQDTPTVNVKCLARELKRHCKEQTSCSTCEFYGGGYGYICTIAPEVDSAAPGSWKIPKG